MQRSSSRLAVVVDMAKRKEDEASAILANRRAALEEEKKRSEDLQDYYQEYETRFLQQTQNLRAESIMQNREFLQQLSQSCRIQQGEVQRLQHEVDLAIAFWHQCHLKFEKLQEHVKKLREQENLEMENQEQKRIDEWVTLQHARKS